MVIIQSAGSGLHCSYLWCYDMFEISKIHNLGWKKIKSAPDWLWKKYRKSSYYHRKDSVYYRNGKHYRYKIIRKGNNNFDVYRHKRNVLDQFGRFHRRNPLVFKSLIAMFIFASLHQFFYVKFWIIDFPLIFYLAEFVFVLSLLWILIKRIERIRFHTDLSLFLAKIFSGIVAFFGFALLWMFWFVGFTGVLMGGSGESFYEIICLGDLYLLSTFGAGFNLPLTGLILFLSLFVGLVLIGGFLFFKFQRRSGRFLWFGRI